MVESTLTKNNQDRVISKEVGLDSDTSYKIKPRAVIFKANEKDLDKIKEIIETQFPNVEIVYITTGPAKSILHITKSMPLKTQSSEQPLFTVE